MSDNIFTPKFVATDRIKQYLEDIERSSWLADSIFIVPKQEGWIRRDVSVQRAVGTTTIEGGDMTEGQVKELEKRRSQRTPSENERDNFNALRAYEFIDYLSDQPDIPINELAIRELNRQFMHGASAVLTPGVFRKGQARVGIYTAPDQGDVPALMRDFAEWLDTDDDMHPVLRAGVAHIHMVAIHPFCDGNGRVARALATLILQRSPFRFRKLLSLEKFMAAPPVQRDYRSHIEQTLGTEFSHDYAATPWLEFFTLALHMHSRSLADKLIDWRRMIEDIYANMAELGVTYRQTEGLAYAHHVGQMSRSDYVEITGVSKETASRDLARLMQKGLLIAKGQTRSRVYLVPEEVKPETPNVPPEQLPLLSMEEVKPQD